MSQPQGVEVRLPFRYLTKNRQGWVGIKPSVATRSFNVRLLIELIKLHPFVLNIYLLQTKYLYLLFEFLLLIGLTSLDLSKNPLR